MSKPNFPSYSSIPATSSEDVVPEYLDPLYWRPKCKNFEIVDWAKWDNLNPAPPKVYDPPQLSGSKEKGLLSWDAITCIPAWWSHRSPFFRTCGIPQCVFRNFTTKPMSSRISDDAIFQEFLDQKLASATTPEMLRGAWWMRDNTGLETLVTFQNFAWKSKENVGNGVVGLGTSEYNWTNDPTCAGLLFNKVSGEAFANIQIHPEEKWAVLAAFTDPREKNDQGENNYVTYYWMYFVQEGDSFVDTNGDRLDYLNPGDIIRLSWTDDPNPDDIYLCDNSKLSFMYTPLRVANSSDDGHGFVKVQPGFDILRRFATEATGKQPLCGGRCTCNMSPKERARYHVTNISNNQVYNISPVPPAANIIERL